MDISIFYIRLRFVGLPPIPRDLATDALLSPATATVTVAATTALAERSSFVKLIVEDAYAVAVADADADEDDKTMVCCFCCLLDFVLLSSSTINNKDGFLDKK